MGAATVDLLPVSGAALSADPRALAAVRTVGTRHGVDYSDDTAVTALLAERRRAVEATQRGPLVWLGGSTLTVGVIWPFLAPILPAFAGKPVLVYAPAGPLLVVAVAALALVRVRWKRELTHPALVGYRETLGIARAHGIRLTHVPAWLEGRSPTGGGKGATPVPAHPPVPPATAQAAASSSSPDHEGTADEGGPAPQAAPQIRASPAASALVLVPPKPPAVTEYEHLADVGGWHDETGWLLVFAGLIGTAWAYSTGSPVGYAALLLVPVAILVWLAGSRQGHEKNQLREEALKYVKSLEAAQAAGAHVPELSPQLRELVDGD
ncbi:MULTISPECIES: hypothetical protein [Streptomyces]|uniref:hypothetical protein n=1 Tax=Streptomyces TaxID=1883 RepID=UPI0003A240E9|nr:MULTISPECIES: hypothetical protein [Streptomyces]AOW88482.1 hypothetical protein BC342_20335 [Streptomyces olivaceus]MBZ6108163.1 hypothetical protein [Streptomyces olivaceus]MBZ6122047.1 hypothetical protein [Streptomyces olivaceus]MBZ6142868.1 hypothetical protein [Streptomyces olivaceus]MBZ6156708.1 hypothetical protein [Streptomyces olivaceus]